MVDINCVASLAFLLAYQNQGSRVPQVEVRHSRDLPPEVMVELEKLRLIAQ